MSSFYVKHIYYFISIYIRVIDSEYNLQNAFIESIVSLIVVEKLYRCDNNPNINSTYNFSPMVVK